jgi:hypothetical protein
LAGSSSKPPETAVTVPTDLARKLKATNAVNPLSAARSSAMNTHTARVPDGPNRVHAVNANETAYASTTMPRQVYTA